MIYAFSVSFLFCFVSSSSSSSFLPSEFVSEIFITTKSSANVSRTIECTSLYLSLRAKRNYVSNRLYGIFHAFIVKKTVLLQNRNNLQLFIFQAGIVNRRFSDANANDRPSINRLKQCWFIWMREQWMPYYYTTCFFFNSFKVNKTIDGRGEIQKQRKWRRKSRKNQKKTI